MRKASTPLCMINRHRHNGIGQRLHTTIVYTNMDNENLFAHFCKVCGWLQLFHDPS
jgi:hypothetical protein